MVAGSTPLSTTVALLAWIFLLLRGVLLPQELTTYDLDTELCSIERIPWSLDGWPHHRPLPARRTTPAIYEVGTAYNSHFRSLVHRESLLAGDMAHVDVTLSSSNSFSHGRTTVKLAHYLMEMMAPLDSPYLTGSADHSGRRSNETWYLFGETFGPEWLELLSHYQLTPCEGNAESAAALSFGIGTRGSGVAFHVHGPGFSEVFQGAKRWFLYPPEHAFFFDPNSTTLAWLNEVYPSLDPPPQECTIKPGDLLYFPHGWMHAVVNTEPYTTFISTFL